MYVQFEDQRHQKRPEQQVSGYAQFLMKLGIARSASQANGILLVIALVGMLTAYLFWQSTTTSDNPANGRPQAELEQAGAPSEIAQ